MKEMILTRLKSLKKWSSDTWKGAFSPHSSTKASLLKG